MEEEAKEKVKSEFEEKRSHMTEFFAAKKGDQDKLFTDRIEELKFRIDTLKEDADKVPMSELDIARATKKSLDDDIRAIEAWIKDHSVPTTTRHR